MYYVLSIKATSIEAIIFLNFSASFSFVFEKRFSFVIINIIIIIINARIFTFFTVCVCVARARGGERERERERKNPISRRGVVLRGRGGRLSLVLLFVVVVHSFWNHHHHDARRHVSSGHSRLRVAIHAVDHAARARGGSVFRFTPRRREF